MQSIIRKIKSMPILFRKEAQPDICSPMVQQDIHFPTHLSPPQFISQVQQLAELIDVMIDDATDYRTIKFSDYCNLL